MDQHKPLNHSSPLTVDTYPLFFLLALINTVRKYNICCIESYGLINKLIQHLLYEITWGASEPEQIWYNPLYQNTFGAVSAEGFSAFADCSLERPEKKRPWALPKPTREKFSLDPFQKTPPTPSLF